MSRLKAVFASEAELVASNSKTVCVVGLGYIGLPTASVLARAGYTVHGVDVHQHVVDTINRGEIHIHEPHLGELVAQVVQAGRLKASLKPCPADIFMICVPTPFHEDRSPDLTYVQKASEAIRPFVKKGDIIILESTSPPRTTLDVVAKHAIAQHLEAGRDVSIAYCPERVLPGRILIEVIENDRVVGGITPACTEKVQAFYETFITGEVLATDSVSAEITKLAENAFRDVNIAYANELSILAEKLDANVFEIIRMANRHPRVNILTPSPGVGGHCISVDPWFLIHACPQWTPLMKTAREVNDSKPHFVVNQVLEAAKQYENPVIGCLGLAYKADVDDLRESPSLEVFHELQAQLPGHVLACEPYVATNHFKQFSLHTLDEVLAQANILVLLTDHTPFKALNEHQLAGKTLIDPRGAWSQVKTNKKSYLPPKVA